MLSLYEVSETATRKDCTTMVVSDGNTAFAISFHEGHFPSSYIDTMLKRILFGANMLDMSATYVTTCGYPVRRLSMTIDSSLKISIQGQFCGSESIWFTRTWDSAGKCETPELNLVQVDEIA